MSAERDAGAPPVRSNGGVAEDRSLVAVLIAVIVFLVYVNAPTVMVKQFGLPELAGAVVLLPLVAIVAYRVVIRGEALRFPAFILAAVLMLAWHSVSALLSDRPLVGFSKVSEWLLQGVFIALLLVNCFRSREEVFAAVRAMVAAGAFMGFVVILQQLLGPDQYGMAGFGQLESIRTDDAGRFLRARLAGPIGEKNRFAQIMAVLIPVAAGLAYTSRGRKRWLYWLAALLICGGVALTYSRGTLVAIVLVVPFALLFGFLRLRHLVVIVVCSALLIPTSPYFAKRVVSIGEVAIQALGLSPGGFRSADGASRGRVTSMQAAGLMFLEHPLIGVGPGQAKYHYQEYAEMVGGNVRQGTRRSHSLYPQLAAETGVVGLIAFMWVIAMVLLPLDRARRRLQESDRQLWGLVCGMELAVLLLLTTSLFLHAAYIRYFWLLLAVAVVVAAASLPGPATMTNYETLKPKKLDSRLGTPA